MNQKATFLEPMGDDFFVFADGHKNFKAILSFWQTTTW